MIDLRLGDCLDVLRTLEAGSVDAVVTDPPAGIGFMGKEWDSFGGRCNANAEADRAAAKMRGGKTAQPFAYSGSALPRKGEREKFIAFLSAVLAECLRVAKPGAVMLCWAIPRTSHWTGLAIEEAGWVIEDRISHLFGTGFPKHKSKLKPGAEDWWLARRPGPKWLGVDAGRIGTDEVRPKNSSRNPYEDFGTFKEKGGGTRSTGSGANNPAGRWPANVCLSHHPECNGACHAECPVRMLDEQSGERAGFHSQRFIGGTAGKNAGWGNMGATPGEIREGYNDTGGASRYFKTFGPDPECRMRYQSKASRRDRNEGLDRHEIIEVEIIPSLQGAVTWDDADLRVQLRVDTEAFRPRVIAGCDAPAKTVSEWNTFLFGSSTTDPSLTGCRFTTETKTSSTTESKTLNWLTRSPTSDCTEDARWSMESGSSPAGSAEPSIPSLTITFDGTVSLPGVGTATNGTRLRIHGSVKPATNIHSTVKSTDLMQWLCRLACPPGGVILDPFMGSGSTGKAAVREGMGFIGIEREPEYHQIATRRIHAERDKAPLLA